LLNVTQIFRVDVAATETQRAVNPAGFKDAYAYKVMKATKAVARNIEVTLFSAAASATGNSASAGRVMRTFQSSDISFVTATAAATPCINVRSLGTATTANGALDEFGFNAIMETIYTNGGNPEAVYVSPSTKRAISSFGTNATGAYNTRNIAADDRKINAAIDVYNTDFGLLQVVTDRWVPQAADGDTGDYTGVAFFLERSKNRLAWLRPVQHVILGKSGDSVRGIVVGEVTLEVLNSCANGFIRGILNPTS